MSDTDNRGKIIWVLASSRPDLIEVDLKRPGRVDVKIPIFPTTEKAESFRLLQALCHTRGVELGDAPDAALEQQIPAAAHPRRRRGAGGEGLPPGAHAVLLPARRAAKTASPIIKIPSRPK